MHRVKPDTSGCAERTSISISKDTWVMIAVSASFKLQWRLGSDIAKRRPWACFGSSSDPFAPDLLLATWVGPTGLSLARSGHVPVASRLSPNDPFCRRCAHDRKGCSRDVPSGDRRTSLSILRIRASHSPDVALLTDLICSGYSVSDRQRVTTDAVVPVTSLLARCLLIDGT